MSQTNTIKIWQPRYHDMTVLVGTHWVKDGLNRVVFTKAYPTKELFMEGSKLRTYPKQPNGKGQVYVVPFQDFEIVEKESKQLSMENI